LKGFVLVSTKTGKEIDVADRIRSKVPGAAVDVVYGVYDIVVTVTGDTNDKMNAVAFQIRNIKDVRSALTLVQI